jgi:hypothetical protein
MIAAKEKTAGKDGIYIFNNQNNTKKVDLVTYFRNNHDQVKIDKNATVMMCYVEIKKDEEVMNNKANAHELPSISDCSITGAIFKCNKSDS